MVLAAGVLGLAVLGALLTGSPGGAPGPGVVAIPMPDHVHVVHRGLTPAALPRPIASLIAPVQRRRVHALDPRTALNLVSAHESRRRRGSKRPPPYHRRGPPRPGPPSRPPRWKGHPKKGRGGPRDKPWTQATRGSSPAATRVRYQTNKPSRSKTKTKGKKSKSKTRPVLPAYADGYAEEDELLHGPPRDPEDPDVEEDRPRKRPSKTTKSTKASKTGKQSSSTSSSTYPKGWGPDGGYRVPAPQYPPYGTDEDEPGTGHLDLEERFINQHNQFYRHGYPADSGEGAPSLPTSTQSKRHKQPTQSHDQGHDQGHGQGHYEDEEIEVAEDANDFADGGFTATSTSSHSTRQQSYRRPSKTTRYSLQDGALHESDESSQEDDYRRPYSTAGYGGSGFGGSYDSGNNGGGYGNGGSYGNYGNGYGTSGGGYDSGYNGDSSSPSANGGSNIRGHGKKKHGDRDRHHSMYHAKFREQQDERTLSAANFNYELTGAASETAQSSVHSTNANIKNNKESSVNHRPAYEAGETAATDVRTTDSNFFRTRKPQYWG